MQGDMIYIEGITFENESFELDGKILKNCVFKNCTLIYGGGKSQMVDVRILHPVLWEFRDAAVNTIRMVQLAGINFKDVGSQEIPGVIVG